MDPIRVLILEDDEDIVDLIRSILDTGYESVSAANGLEGLQMAENAEPDLVICDIMMPIMDGWEFMRSLRTRSGFEHTPVIFLSALSSQDQIRKGYSLGAALYITKPLNPARLKRVIDLFISDHGIVSRPKRRRIGQLQASADGFLNFADTAPQPPPSPPPRRQRLEPRHFNFEPDRPAQRAQAETEPPPRPAARKPIITPPPPGAFAPAPPYPPPSPPAPAPPQSHAPEPARSKAEELLARPAGDRVRVLVVDDDKDTCQMLHEGLAESFDVLEAGDGITAIERAMRYKPDIFIIDGMLPRMTGYQLTLMLKKNREFYKAPIVFISGKATQRDQDYARSLGITYFVAKPFTPAQIIGVLRSLVAQPEFAIHPDRLSVRPGAAESFTRFETQRHNTGTPSLAEMEQQAFEQRLKQQLSDS